MYRNFWIKGKEYGRFKENDERLIKSKKVYKFSNIMNTSMSILAAGGLMTFVVAPQGILKLSGLLFGCISSCLGLYFMGAKKYKFAKAELETASKVNSEILEIINERYADDILEESIEK